MIYTEPHHLLTHYQRTQREVERIRRGPVPVERMPRMAWDNALLEAEGNCLQAMIKCADAGITTSS